MAACSIGQAAIALAIDSLDELLAAPAVAKRAVRGAVYHGGLSDNPRLLPGDSSLLTGLG